MPEREMNPNPGNARRFRIAADAGETAIDIVLPEALPGDRRPESYRVVKKDIPEEAKGKTYGRINGKPAVVKWINCFGIRLRGTFGGKSNPFIEEVSGEQFEYEVIVPASSRPEGYTNLVYFDGTDVQLAIIVAEDNEGYHFKLNIGDPPTGWGDG